MWYNNSHTLFYSHLIMHKRSLQARSLQLYKAFMCGYHTLLHLIDKSEQQKPTAKFPHTSLPPIAFTSAMKRFYRGAAIVVVLLAICKYSHNQTTVVGNVSSFAVFSFLKCWCAIAITLSNHRMFKQFHCELMNNYCHVYGLISFAVWNVPIILSCFWGHARA